MPLSRVLIIEDDQIFLDTLSSTLRLKLPDTYIETAGSGANQVRRVCSHHR
jgi:hypothetical protein